MQLLSSPSSEDYSYDFVQLKPQETKNLSIDSAYISELDPDNFKLNLQISGSTNSENPLVSVYDGTKLLGRKSLEITNELAEVQFDLQNNEINNGIVKLEDQGLEYDDRLYFSKPNKTAIKVVAISNADSSFLRRIYTSPEFELKIFEPGEVDFNELSQANLIVLNEISEFSNALIGNIRNETENGSNLIIIPPSEINADYSTALNKLGISGNFTKIDSEKLITEISFDHPLLKNVFEEEIQNFEYPKVSSSYKISNGNSILKYQDGNPFLFQTGSVYFFTAALNNQNSNFQSSPLIVPVFYQIGLQSLKTSPLYYSTGERQTIDVAIEVSGDQVLHLENSEMNIIPQQQNFSKKVKIFTTPYLLNSGNYQVTSNDKAVNSISFNDDRSESNLSYFDLNDFENISIYNSVQEYFAQSKAASEITALWKWFIIFALIFLAIEMLLIKFLK